MQLQQRPSKQLRKKMYAKPESLHFRRTNRFCSLARCKCQIKSLRTVWAPVMVRDTEANPALKSNLIPLYKHSTSKNLILTNSPLCSVNLLMRTKHLTSKFLIPFIQPKWVINLKNGASADKFCQIRQWSREIKARSVPSRTAAHHSPRDKSELTNITERNIYWNGKTISLWIYWLVCVIEQLWWNLSKPSEYLRIPIALRLKI